MPTNTCQQHDSTPKALLVSLVIPAFNENDRLPALLRSLATGKITLPGQIEVIVSDDGSEEFNAKTCADAVDEANALAHSAAAPLSFRSIRSPVNRGKGAAIRLGWHEASSHASWLGFMDADGATDAAECKRLIGLLAYSDSYDVLAGSRIKMAGKRIERRLFRHLQGRAFATLVDSTFDLGFYDTQCGVKFFRGAMLRPKLDLLGENRWLLDIELLALMKRLGARMREEPIDWVDQSGSKVRFGVDALRMAAGLVRIHRRLNRLDWNDGLSNNHYWTIFDPTSKQL